MTPNQHPRFLGWLVELGPLLPAVGALGTASAVGLFLLGLKIFWTGHWRELYLVWNLFLAWLPLICAFASRRLFCPNRLWDFNFLFPTAAWLFFFPNSTYIFTDLIHLSSPQHSMFWVDMILILLFALTGLVAGFLSLYLMQRMIRRWIGQAGSWVFVLLIAGLSGLGVYLGRFLRWNTWDLLFQPWNVAQDIGRMAIPGGGDPLSTIFPALYGIFFFVAYLLLYSLTRLDPGQRPRAHIDAKIIGAGERGQ